MDSNLQEIPPEFWWIGLIVTCITGTLVPAFSAIGAWLLYKVWPYIVSSRASDREYSRRNENVALDIAKETIAWSREELEDLRKSFVGLHEDMKNTHRVVIRQEHAINRVGGLVGGLIPLVTDMYERQKKDESLDNH